MQKRARKLLMAVWFLIIGGLLSLSFGTESVSAYSASLTTSGNIEINVAPTGTSRRGVANGYDNIVVNTDCRSGYTLTVATPEGSDLYKYTNGTQGNTPSFTAVANNTPITDSANVNKWGYSLTGSSYYPLSTTPSVLKTPSETASSTDISDSFGIDYGINADQTIDPGTYKMANNGSIVYYLTMDATCVAYTINFNANGGTGTMDAQSIPASQSTHLASSSSIKPPVGDSYTDAGNHTITGNPDLLWTFWGWNTSIDGTGDWYKDREEVTDLAQAGSSITLYAQWKQATLADLTTSTPVGTEKTIDHNTMQDMSPETCHNSDKFTAIGTPYGQATLTDNRDGTTRTYTVAKLPDGLCWMTQNLNLGASTAITLTPDDTDITENFTLPASNPSDYTTGTDQASINKAMVLNNMTVPDYTVNSTVYSGKVNAYYSFAAATADINTYSKSSATTVTTSICPRNWDLPTYTQYDNLRTKGSIAAYNNTNSSYAGKNAGNEPYYFIYGGYRKAAGNEVNTTYFNSPTTYGYLWTANNSTYRFGSGIYVFSSGLYNTISTYNKYYGLSMRCIASNGTATVHYNANGGSGTMADQSGDINALTVSPNSFTAQVGRQFRNWNTRADGTGTTITAGTPLSSIVSNGDEITLYAQWDEVYYISFNANESSVGGTSGSATGTMTNQTVIRDTATAIKTNTFALSNYIFMGWNTRADGTGTTYTDGQKITNLTTTGNTITLYAVWMNGALLDDGGNVNQKLKRLAGDSSAISTSQDDTITAIVRSNSLPNDFTPVTENTISHSSSPNPIYAWYDSSNTTIYYYSSATTIVMNASSNNLFYEMRALSNLSTISTWNTAKVTTMDSMFYYTGYSASSFVLDLSSWNTSSVTSMNRMFYYAGRSATTWSIGDLSSWNTSSVTNMNQMFYFAGYKSTTWSIGNLSSWNTSSVTNMNQMFSSAGYSATTWSIGNLSSWNTSSVTDMSYMFSSAGYNATTFTLDLSSWNTSSVTKMSNMFSSAGYNATTFILDLSSWNTSSVTNMSNMFFSAGRSAATWSIGDLSSWNTSNVTNMSYIFSYAGYNATTFTLNLSSWNTSSVTNMREMFSYAGYSATTWSIGDLSSWGTSSVTNMSSIFSYAGYSATTWSIGNLSSWNTSSVTDMTYMFYKAGYSANTFILNLSSWNTSSVTRMTSMFSSAGYSATTWSIGDLSSWNTSNVTNMYALFEYAGYSATSWSIGDLSSWNTSSVTSMYHTFWSAGYSATTFTLDLSSWNTSSVTNINQMFYYAGTNATTWSVTIPKTNDGTATGPIANTTSRLYGKTTSAYTTPPTGRSFTLAP